MILELLIGTGIRISELCTLKHENIILLRNVIKIYGKGAKERVIPIYNSNVVEALKIYKDIYSKESLNMKWLFINKRKNRLSTQSVRNIIKKYCLKVKINRNITPHMFRHTFATMLLDQDVDTRYIQMLLGYSNITTTQIYTHITSNKKNEIMKYKNPRLKIILNEG